MPERTPLLLRFSSAGVVFAGFLALTAVREYSPLILFFPLLLLLLTPPGEWLDRHYRAYRIFSKGISITFLCFIPLFFLILGVLNGVLVVIVFVLAYTLLHKKSESNYYHLYLMSFFLVLAACAQSPEPLIGLAMLLFLVSSIWAFIALRLYMDALISIATPPEIIGKTGAVSAAPINLSARFDAGLILAIFLVSCIAVVLTSVFFVATPRVEAGFLGRNPLELTRTGIPRTVNLARRTILTEDATAVMRVTFPDEPNGQYTGEMYWRITTLPRYDGVQWKHAPLNDTGLPNVPNTALASLMAPFRSHVLVADRSKSTSQRIVRQEIYMEDVPSEGIPCLDLVWRVSLQSTSRGMSVLWDSTKDFTVLLQSIRERRAAYEVLSEIPHIDPALLRAAPTDYAARMPPQDFTLLTRHDLLPETMALVNDITKNAQNPYDKACAIQAWLSGPNFRYSLIVPPLPERNPMDAFLLRERRGHCELFSSAMALMLRGLGIPARVVSGYRGGEWNTFDGSYTIRARMAHLWVEALFPGVGWVRFDPSPRSNLEDPMGFRAMAGWLSGFSLRAKMLWHQEVIRFDRGAQLKRLQDLSLGLVRWFQKNESEETPPETAPQAPPALSGTMKIAVILLVGVLILMAFLRPQRISSRPAVALTDDQKRAQTLYRNLIRKLGRFGVSMPNRVPGEEFPELPRELESAKSFIQELLSTYLECRFGKRPLSRNHYRLLLRNMRHIGKNRPISP